MAKLTALQIVNKVLRNCGLISRDLSSLSNLNVMQTLVLDAINESILEIGLSEHWKPLEATGTITLVADQQDYTQPSDMNDFDKKSFIYSGDDTNVEYYTPQEVDELYPSRDATGAPKIIWEFEGKWNVYYIPSSGQEGETITYRYWKIPTTFDGSDDDATCWFPEGFDKLVLVNHATYKVLHYRGNAEAQIYYLKVFGDLYRRIEGTLDKMRHIWMSPKISRVRVTAK